MYGLKAIILHDSYYRGLRTRISCEGHTNNTGDNGSGKTSALTLIPIFYGKNPDSLIERAGDKSKFVDYYLPSRQSMVIFEYSRQMGICCAVMYRKRDGSFAYRFIQGNADTTLFSEKMKPLFKSGLDANRLLRLELPKHGIQVSKQVDRIIDYRAIIQNDTKRLKSRSQSGVSFRQETLDFCLGSASSHMKHIEALTSVVLKQDRLLRQFKIMIVDSFLDNQISIGTLPYHHKDASLIQDLKSLQAFVSHQTKINKAISDYHVLNAEWSAIKGYSQQISQQMDVWSQEIQQYQDSLVALKREMDEKEEHYDNKYKLLSSKIVKYEAQKEQADNDIRHLLKQKEKWNKQDIHLKKESLKNLPQLIKTSEIETAHYAKLSNAIEEHQDQHEAEKKSMQYDAEQQKSTESARELQIRTTLHKKEVEHQTHLDKLRDAKDNAIEVYRKQRAKEQESLNVVLIQAKVNVKTAQQPTSKEEEELEQLKQERKTNKTSLQQATAYHQSCVEKSTQSEQKRQEAEITYQKHKQKIDVLRQQQEEYSQQLYPKDNTLLAFLRASEVDWHDTIGKVIQPSLLQRTDLSPLFSDMDSSQEKNELYGLSLALEAVSHCNEARSEDELRQMLQDLEVKIDNAEDDLENQKSYLKKCNKTVKTDNNALSRAKHQQTTSEKKLTQTDNFIEACEVKISAQGKKRKATAKVALRLVEEQIKAFKDETERDIQQITQQYDTQQAQKKEEWLGTKAQHTAQLERIKQSIEAITTSLNKRLQELEHQFKRLLKNKAIDTEALTTAQNRRNAANKKVTTVKGYKSIVDDYQEWQQRFWSRKPEWEEKSIQCDRRIKQLGEQRSKHQITYKAYIKETSKERKQRLKTLTDIEKLNEQAQIIIQNADNVLRYAPVDLEADQQNRPNSASLLLQQANSLLKAEQNLKDDIITTIREIIRIIEKGHTDSQIYQFWQALYSKHQQSSQHTEMSKEFYLESIHDIQSLNEQGVSQIQRGLLESIRAIGSRIYHYHETLELLNKNVNTISRRLEKNINTEHQFPAISDIRINLISKISELDLWKDLKNFKQQWEQWNEEESESLPNADFIKALADVSRVMKNSNIDNNLYSLVDLQISLTENGRVVPIRTDDDLKNASSTGISLLAVIVVFCGMTRYLCDDSTIRIHWPLDEIGRLSSNNTSLLFDMMDTHNIALFCAQPNPSPALNRYFIHKNELNNKTGVRQYLPRIQQKKSNPLLATLAKETIQKQPKVEADNESTIF